MKKILIIGGGFAGLSALDYLRRRGDIAGVTLIDKKGEFNFLPMLPDIVGSRVRPESLACGIEELGKKWKFRFVQATVQSVSPREKTISTTAGVFPYDFLLIAGGSETDFFGNRRISERAFKLDNVEDGRKILAALREGNFSNVVIAGAGYTGIEIATNLRCRGGRDEREVNVIMVELKPVLLGPLPEWMREYTRDNLRRLKIEVFFNAVIKEVAGDRVILSTGEEFERALLVWSAGVRTPDFIQRLEAEKTRQGRIIVDEFLRLDEHCYVAGDSAAFVFRGKPLRMAVQFSISQGRAAARNIVNQIRGMPLKRYRPVDLGYLVPMANRRSCGIVLGANVRGRPATFLHYLMCVYRSISWRNRAAILKDLIV